ncbi:GNAT family N-acetyltransferase [Pseudomonas sp. No.21]|jgi:ribosomal protein S18 acetylase RimI-like enzyme|uniref:GNAT family N-acetyltransferase n=1 Tax=Pseudomonas TaxID=286 RepID=UPI000DA8F678|nr:MULTISPECIES: GNAT family N-acetyltransferase [Pseudomonas]MDW3712438.1 GNAT family N-acetyltransferase [Pseudomonas sp. 2023EL-01195]PZE11190.1 GNAT family N-acetyltransferase [Pseudomonas sp. 57B-090624]GJN45875.1 N-acetyltransferase [Pseudomonas tohonis]
MDGIPGGIEFPGLQVRRLVPDDLERVCVHREAMFLEAGGDPARLRVMTEHFRPWLRERLADGRYYGFALMDEARVAAAIGLMSIEWPPHPSHPEVGQRGYVLNVFVEPDYRRRGLASALMKLAEAEFNRRGLGFAVLHATQVGRPVYEALGWAATSEMAKAIG